MKICIDGRMILSSGIGTIIQNFLHSFSGEFNLFIIGNKSEILPFVAGKKNYQIIESKIPIYSISEQLILPFLIPACDVFWSPHYNIPLLPIRAKRRFVIINDVFHLTPYASNSKLKKIYASYVINTAIKKSDKVFTVSEFSRSEIIKYTKSIVPVEIVKCGIDLNRFYPIDDRQSLEEVRHKYNLPSKFILCVGNIKPHKNLKTLVLAFNEIQKEMPGFKLVIVGRKEGFITGDTLLIESINKNTSGNILLTGFVSNEDLPKLYNLASLFVFPSLYEGFGLPPLEAMACGCPVVVSNVASIPEVCGNSARYFNPLSADDMKKKIGEALLSNNEDLINNGLSHVKAFSWNSFYNSYVKAFQRISDEEISKENEIAKKS